MTPDSYSVESIRNSIATMIDICAELEVPLSACGRCGVGLKNTCDKIAASGPNATSGLDQSRYTGPSSNITLPRHFQLALQAIASCREQLTIQATRHHEPSYER